MKRRFVLACVLLAGCGETQREPQLSLLQEYAPLTLKDANSSPQLLTCSSPSKGIVGIGHAPGDWDYIVVETPKKDWVFWAYPASPRLPEAVPIVTVSAMRYSAGHHFDGFSARDEKRVPIFDRSGTYRIRMGRDAETDDPVWIQSCEIEYQKVTSWQPIKSFDTGILGWLDVNLRFPTKAATGFFHPKLNCWVLAGTDTECVTPQPTHWQPLPVTM